MTELVAPDELADWRVCPVCAGDLELVQSEPGEQANAVCRGRCGKSWYANSKPTANILVEHPEDGRLLLVKRARDPFKDHWDTPGGFVKEDESGEDAARREVEEETGLIVDDLQFVGIWHDVYGTDRGMHTFNVFYRGVCSNPDDVSAASDASEVQWFSREELPPAEDLGFDCVPRAIAAWAGLLGH